jgi:hypothetical protein
MSERGGCRKPRKHATPGDEAKARGERSSLCLAHTRGQNRSLSSQALNDFASPLTPSHRPGKLSPRNIR